MSRRWPEQRDITKIQQNPDANNDIRLVYSISRQGGPCSLPGSSTSRKREGKRKEVLLPLSVIPKHDQQIGSHQTQKTPRFPYPKAAKSSVVIRDWK